MKKYKMLKVLASFALVFSVMGANSACVCFFHQPEKPDLKSLRRF